MSEEQKPKTAIQLEKEMLAAQRDNQIVEEVEKETGSEKAKLGIHNLKKTFKGKLLLGGVFLILLAGITIYNFPNIIRALSSDGEEKKQEETQTTSRSNRLTDLNKDIAFDPQLEDSENSVFMGGDKQVNTVKTSTDKSVPVEPPKPPTFSRALAQGTGASSSSQPNSTGGNDKSDTDGLEGDSERVAKSVTTDKNTLNAISILPYDPNLFIPENTAIPCSLDRRFVSDLSGKLTCTVNDDIYSANGNVKLIERGTRASLIYKSGTLNHGQGRAFIIATKLRTRTQPFIDIPLIDTEAAGALGETGVEGWIDTHFWDRFGGAMMLGMIPDAMQGLSNAAKNNKDSNSDYTANSREAFADIAREAFANSVNIPPTLYKNQGEIITLITGEDLDFSKIYRLKMGK